MNNKFYVSLETARLLKEKGYRERYHAYYFGDSNLRKGGYRGDSWYDSPDFYPAPTKSEVIDWLAEMLTWSDKKLEKYVNELLDKEKRDEEERKQKQEEAERKEYERLKQKFG